MIPEPTPVSFLLPSMNMLTVDCFMSLDSHIVTNFDGCIQIFGSTICANLFLPLMIAYCCAASLDLIVIGTCPVIMHKASLDFCGRP